MGNSSHPCQGSAEGKLRHEDAWGGGLPSTPPAPSCRVFGRFPGTAGWGIPGIRRDARSGRTRVRAVCPCPHAVPPAPIPAGLAAGTLLAPTSPSAPRLAPRPGTQRGEAVPRAGICLRPGLGCASQEGSQRGGSSPLPGAPPGRNAGGGFVGLTLLRDPGHTQMRGAEAEFAASPPRVPQPLPGAAQGDRAEVTQLPALLRGGTEAPRGPGWGQEQDGDVPVPVASSSQRKSPFPRVASIPRCQGSNPRSPGAQGHLGDSHPIPAPGQAPPSSLISANPPSAAPRSCPRVPLSPVLHPSRSRCSASTPTATWRVHQGPQCRGRAGVSAGDTGSGRAGAPKPTG